MNQLMLAMAMSGRGVSPSTMKAMQASRQRSYEKLTMFIKFLVAALVQGYYWLKKHPDIVLKDSSGAATKTPDFTGEGTQALVNAFWSRSDQKDFIVTLLREGATLLIEWLKPDPYEMDMWGLVLQDPSPTAALPDLVTSQHALMNNLIAHLQQSVPAGSVTTGGGLPPLASTGLTREQYFNRFGAWPPVDANSPAVGSTPLPNLPSGNGQPGTGTILRSRNGGLF